MSALLATVLGASLIGSPHCAGMCGPLLVFYAAEGGREKQWLGHAFYSLGRLLSYTGLGALAGIAGHAINIAGEAAGVMRFSAILAGSLMVLWGLGVIVARFGITLLPRGLMGSAGGRWFQKLFARMREKPPLFRALALGLASTLLPCGWLYAFVITAAGTGSPWQGALVMGAFWTGTLPVMLALGVGIQKLAGPLRRHLPVIGAVAVLCMGLVTVYQRAGIEPERFSGITPRVVVDGEEARPAGDTFVAPCCEDE